MDRDKIRFDGADLHPRSWLLLDQVLKRFSLDVGFSPDSFARFCLSPQISKSTSPEATC
jgi:hypothetical protein